MVQIISLEGNIGSGKSTLINYLKSNFDNIYNVKNKKILYLQEPIDIWNEIKDENGNNIIKNYYENQEKYAFPFQMMAYISRLASLKNIINDKNEKYDIIFIERSIFTDKNVFAKMLYDDKKINQIEYSIYNLWFDEFLKDIPNINFIYLKTDYNIAFNRVLKRNRPGENISLDYLNKCNLYHEDWLNKIKSEVLVIDGNIEINDNIIKEWINVIINELINI